MTARIVFRISVVALLLYLAVTQKCPASGRSESSIIGWMLRGHVYDTLLAELPFTCVFKCREDNRCQSFNWVISLLTCEFNNRTKEARPEDFIPNPDGSYYPRDLKRGEPAYQEGVYSNNPSGLHDGERPAKWQSKASFATHASTEPEWPPKLLTRFSS